MKHAMECFGRLVRLLLGDEAVADHKSGVGLKLVVLGVEITVGQAGVQCRPAPDKVVKWLDLIDDALSRKHLAPGVASKLAGKLTWACGSMFRRLGRATLRPIFDQTTRRDGNMALELQHSLQWWKKVLQYGVTESKPWKEPEGADVHIFCDAAGSGGLGAVLLAGRQVFFVHQQAPEELSRFFKVRSDKQILGLELLAISLALSSFAHLLRGRRVVIHSDNTGNEVEFTFSVLQ